MEPHPCVLCNGCRGQVVGVRHKCIVCANYDLCDECRKKGFHPEHEMREILRTPEPGYLHRRVRCDCCLGQVRGIRYKCTSCSNYDLCSGCRQNGIHGQHTFREIHGPNKVSALRELEHLMETMKVGTTETSSDQNIPLGDPSPMDSTTNPTPASATEDEFTARWSPAQPGIPFKRQPLDSSDPEYQAVVANMSAHDGGAWTQKIKLICRIENYRLYKFYKLCKEEMERENGPEFQNERILWHGTRAETLSNIYRDGFNRNYCGKNGTAFGLGVYFASTFSYSTASAYSPPDANGQKYIFQCRVLTGHYIRGGTNLKEPPMRTRRLRYDSVVDIVVAPRMFVVFKDMQVYPEYVITLDV